MEKWNVSKPVMILVVVLCLTGCADHDFSEAKRLNTAAAYSNFLKKYPNHTLSKKARELGEPLSCEEAKKENTVECYLSYLQLYPEGKCAPEEVRLIAQLNSPSEKKRNKAADLLSYGGEELTKSVIDEIINIMRNGRGSWSKHLYRQSHCTWYEKTTVKYYAAKSLVNMKSPYVTDEIVREARNKTNKEKTRYRVTDPGWICY
jgi:hypothetical protein